MVAGPAREFHHRRRRSRGDADADVAIERRREQSSVGADAAVSSNPVGIAGNECGAGNVRHNQPGRRIWISSKLVGINSSLSSQAAGQKQTRNKLNHKS